MKLFVALMLILSAGRESHAQAPPPQPPPVQGVVSAAAVNPAMYVIGPQDVLKVTVFDEPDLSQSYRVDSDGMVTFPLLGRVAAGGQTLREFQEKLRDQLANGFLRNPQVRAEVEQYKSQSVFVLGEVRTPGRISMMGTKTLLEALAEAGSPTGTASAEVVITHPRRSPDVPQVEDDRIDLRDLQTAQTYLLHDGDMVTVTKARMFFISGEVRNNASYVYQPDMTLAQAVTLAGGLTDRGTYRGAYASRIVKGKSIKVDLDEQDKIQPDDTIKIGKRIF